MPIKYESAPDILARLYDIAKKVGMGMEHVQFSGVYAVRSRGSASRGTIARCHAMGKAMQIALNRKGYYLIEVISKRFDKMSEEDKTKVIIHELMHIPKTFGGGFIHHNVVHEGNVKNVYEHFCKLKEDKNKKWF